MGREGPRGDQRGLEKLPAKWGTSEKVEYFSQRGENNSMLEVGDGSVPNWAAESIKIYLQGDWGGGEKWKSDCPNSIASVMVGGESYEGRKDAGLSLKAQRRLNSCSCREVKFSLRPTELGKTLRRGGVILNVACRTAKKGGGRNGRLTPPSLSR